MLLEALLRASFDELTARVGELETSSSPDDALVAWLREAVAVAHNHRGVVASMVAAIADPNSALHASCVTMRAAGTRLLTRAHVEGMARIDIDGGDLFALVGALAWLADQPSLAPGADRCQPGMPLCGPRLKISSTRTSKLGRAISRNRMRI